MNDSLRIAGRGQAKLRNGLIPESVCRTLIVQFQSLRVHMHLIHVKDVIRRSKQHTFALGQHKSLQHIDDLRQIGHLHPFIVIVEQVQVNSRHKRIPHRVLLVQETRVGSRLHVVPRPPLIDDQRNLVLRIVFVHNLRMLHDQFFHMKRAFQSAEPGCFVKSGRFPFILPVPCRERVIVQT
ncbi:hypothetical protein D1872_261990 [compost metagenome]